MSNLARSSFQAHPFHLVSPSPWPLYTSISLFSLTLSAVLTFHSFSNALILLYNGLIVVIYSMGLWFFEKKNEGTYHTFALQRGLSIISKAFFFILAILGGCFLLLAFLGVYFLLILYMKTSIPERDAAEPWGLFFQDNATPRMEGLEELHNNIMFYLAIVLFAVSWVMLSIIINYRKAKISNKYVNHGTLVELIWTITPALILVLVAFPSFKLLYLMDEFIDPSLVIYGVGHQWYWMMQPYEFVSFGFIDAEGGWVESNLDLVPKDVGRLYMNSGTVANGTAINILNPNTTIHIEQPLVNIDWKLQKDRGKLMLIDLLDNTGTNLLNHWVPMGSENMPALENWSSGVTRHQGICLNPYGYDTNNMESITIDDRIYSGKATDRWFRPANYTSGGRPLLYKNDQPFLVWNSRRK